MIRLACAYGQLPLQDVRISREQFAVLKASGKLAYGQIPVLEVTEGHDKKKTVIAQSSALMRYVGKRTGLYPLDDDVQAAVVDSLVDHVNDLMGALHMTKFPGNKLYPSLSLAIIKIKLIYFTFCLCILQVVMAWYYHHPMR